MAFMKPATATPKPRRACVGKVGGIGEVKAPGDGRLYHSVAVELLPEQSGLKATVFLRFWPEAFSTDPDTLAPNPSLKKGADPKNDELRSRYFTYQLNIASSDRPAYLQGLVGPQKWPDFVAALEAQCPNGKVDPEKFRAALAKFASGNGVAYVLKQSTRKDESTGKVMLQDNYEVGSVLPLTREIADGLVRQAKNSANHKDVSKRLELMFALKQNA